MNTLFDISGHTTKNEFEIFTKDFQTPPAVCKYMVSLLPKGIKKVLEPTPGLGNLVVTLQEAKYKVTAPVDFFLLPSTRYDAVVMNPPFSCKYARLENSPMEIKKDGLRLGYYILSQCMEMSDTIIALMPIFTITDSDVRIRHFKKWGLQSITQLPRATFAYTRIQTIVMHLQKGYQGETIYKLYEQL